EGLRLRFGVPGDEDLLGGLQNVGVFRREVAARRVARGRQEQPGDYGGAAKFGESSCHGYLSVKTGRGCGRYRRTLCVAFAAIIRCTGHETNLATQTLVR